MNIDDEFDAEYEIITMTDENGDDIDFLMLDCVTVGKHNYLLLISADEDEDEEDSEAFIFKEIKDEGEDSIYEIIEDDEEFNKIIQLFQSNEDFEIEL